MKGGLGEGETCVACASVGDCGGEGKVRESEGLLVLPLGVHGAPGLRAELVCEVLKAGR